MARIKDGHWDSYIKRVVAYLNTHQARLGVNGADLAKLNSLLADWNAFFLPSKNADKRTKTITQNKNQARKKLEQLLAKIKSDTPQSVLTTEDRETLLWKKHERTNRPVPVADREPVILFVSSAHLSVELKFRHPEHAHRRLPYRNKLLLEYFVGEKGVEVTKILFNQASLVSRSRKMVYFKEADRGKTVYFRARFVNAKGDVGVSSEIINVILN